MIVAMNMLYKPHVQGRLSNSEKMLNTDTLHENPHTSMNVMYPQMLKTKESKITTYTYFLNSGHSENMRVRMIELRQWRMGVQWAKEGKDVDLLQVGRRELIGSACKTKRRGIV